MRPTIKKSRLGYDSVIPFIMSLVFSKTKISTILEWVTFPPPLGPGSPLGPTGPRSPFSPRKMPRHSSGPSRIGRRTLTSSTCSCVTGSAPFRASAVQHPFSVGPHQQVSPPYCEHVMIHGCGAFKSGVDSSFSEMNASSGHQGKGAQQKFTAVNRRHYKG